MFDYLDPLRFYRGFGSPRLPCARFAKSRDQGAYIESPRPSVLQVLFQRFWELVRHQHLTSVDPTSTESAGEVQPSIVCNAEQPLCTRLQRNPRKNLFTVTPASRSDAGPPKSCGRLAWSALRRSSASTSIFPLFLLLVERGLLPSGILCASRSSSVVIGSGSGCSAKYFSWGVVVHRFVHQETCVFLAAKRRTGQKPPPRPWQPMH